MNLLIRNQIKTFSLLSIGHRGVGKTVFLAGSYAELHGNLQKHSPKFWFDCKEIQEQQNIETLLGYISQTGQYPPPTMKITDFNFSLKRRSLWGERVLSHFRWWEIPGEICQMSDQDFREMVAASHGCCVFIDADALMHEQDYLQQFENIVELTSRLAFLVVLNDLKDYAFALILTKCDKLAPSAFNQQLEDKLQPLTESFERVKANYQIFYSQIAIVHSQGTSTLNASGAAAPLLWLVWQLSQTHALDLMDNLMDFVDSLWPNGLNIEQQQQQERQDDSLQKLFRPSKLNTQKALVAQKPVADRNNRLLFILAIVILMGFAGLFSIGYNLFRQTQPKNLRDITDVSTLQQSRSFYLSAPLLERLVQQRPHDLELRLRLAELYRTTGQVTKAETAYDWVLAQQKNNLEALIGKAITCRVKGDMQTAKTLFVRAEAVAPIDIKPRVRELAQKALQSPTTSTPSSQ